MAGVCRSASAGHRIDLATDVIYLVFARLDAQSLLNCAATCRNWAHVADAFKQTFWKALCAKTWNMDSCCQSGYTWQQFYKTHHAIQNANYLFVSDQVDFAIEPEPQQNQVAHSPIIPEERKRVSFIWPFDPSSVYTLVHCGKKVCWIDTDVDGGMTKIYVTEMRPDSEEQNAEPYFVLKGHQDPIGLILANQDHHLISFDDRCRIFIWDLDTYQCVRVIETEDVLEFIFSMNVEGSRVVAGGRNGKIAVWDYMSGELELVVSIPEEAQSDFDLQDEKLVNVAIWGDCVAYGLFTGCFYVYSIIQKKQVHFFQLQDVPIIAVPAATPPFRYRTVSEPIYRQNNSVRQEPFQLIDHFDPAESIVPSHAPMTLAINGHILITNGRSRDEIIVWDLVSGKYVTTLSETIAMRKQGLPAPPFRAVKFAELSADTTCIFATVCSDDECSLLLWDFSGQIHHKELKRVILPGPAPIDAWVAWNTVV